MFRTIRDEHSYTFTFVRDILGDHEQAPCFVELVRNAMQGSKEKRKM